MATYSLKIEYCAGRDYCNAECSSIMLPVRAFGDSVLSEGSVLSGGKTADHNNERPYCSCSHLVGQHSALRQAPVL